MKCTLSNLFMGTAGYGIGWWLKIMTSTANVYSERLMKQMGIMALYPKKGCSRPGKGHKIYPYWLKGLSIDRPNQVFCTDITYIPMAKGFVYLVAIMDWHSRKFLSWRLSNTMGTDFCVDALKKPLSVMARQRYLILIRALSSPVMLLQRY